MEFLWVILWTLVAVIGAAVLFFVFGAVCCLFIDPQREYDKNSKFYRFLLNGLTVLILGVVRVKICVTGKEKLPTEERFLLVCNHRSNYDPLVTWLAFRKSELAFVSKEGNFKIPFFGRLIRKCCFMAIDRENPRNAVKTINKASELLKNDEVSVGIYPEGTRSKSCELLPFHNSVFKIAQKAGVPIVVCSIEGTEKIAKRTPWRSTRVQLCVLEIISKEDVARLRTAELGERVRLDIEQKIKQEERTNEDLRTV